MHELLEMIRGQSKEQRSQSISVTASTAVISVVVSWHRWNASIVFEDTIEPAPVKNRVARALKTGQRLSDFLSEC